MNWGFWNKKEKIVEKNIKQNWSKTESWDTPDMIVPNLFIIYLNTLFTIF